jgi:hypothetical protein
MTVFKHADFEVPQWGEFAAGPQAWVAPAYTDSFDRPDETLESSPTWLKKAGGASVSNDTLIGLSDALYAFDAPVNDDQYAQAEAINLNNSGFCAVRVQDGLGGYACRVLNSGTLVRLIRVESDGTHNVRTSVAVAGGSVGDVYRLEAEGSMIRLKRNGVVLTSMTDTTYPTGKVGVAAGATTSSGIYADNWEGGNL